MRNFTIMRITLFIVCGILFIAGCGGGGVDSSSISSGSPVTDIKLVFVVSPDLANNAGDINPSTANLSNQGLQRALMLAAYLKTTLLGSANPKGIYALEPCTHQQTANNYPDMVPLEIMEQFALLNQYTLFQTPPAQDVTAASFPINVSYTAASLPPSAPAPPAFYPNCQGIDFSNNGGGNEALVNGIIASQQSGFYVFAMPFETLKSLLGTLKSLNSYDYRVPDAWEGPNILYVLTVPSGSTTAVLSTYDTRIEPGTAYPTPSIPYQEASNLQSPFVIQPSTVSGSSLPPGINTNETVYFIRHGEAHPTEQYDDGNMIMQGDWRALYIPGALSGKIKTPDYVYGPDPSQAFPGMNSSYYPYVRPSMTVAPYAIANGIPFYVASSFLVGGLTAPDDAIQVAAAVKFFFSGGRFSSKTLLVGWEHVHIQEIAQALVNLYFADTSNAPTVPQWPGNSDDYDTIWTFSLDGNGNLTVSNLTCEGINSSTLPSTAPIFKK